MLGPRQRHRFAFKMLKIESSYGRKGKRIVVTNFNTRRKRLLGYDIDRGDRFSFELSGNYRLKTFNSFKHKQKKYDKKFRLVNTDYVSHWWGSGYGGFDLSLEKVERMFELFFGRVTNC